MAAKYRVCLVDDEASIRNSLQMLLKTAGIEMVSFASAQEFLSSFDPKKIGCILLDVRLPGMSELELQEILTTGKRQFPSSF